MFTLWQAVKARRGRGGMAVLFLWHCARWGGCWSPRRGRFTHWFDPVPVHEAGWGPVPVWTNAENFANNGIRSPDTSCRYPDPSIQMLTCVDVLEFIKPRLWGRFWKKYVNVYHMTRHTHTRPRPPLPHPSPGRNTFHRRFHFKCYLDFFF
jgi:hypothetical protein